MTLSSLIDRDGIGRIAKEIDDISYRSGIAKRREVVTTYYGVFYDVRGFLPST
jgi:hypothetical protein